MYQHENRIAFKGQMFSAPMNWNDLLKQLQEMEKDEKVAGRKRIGEATTVKDAPKGLAEVSIEDKERAQLQDDFINGLKGIITERQTEQNQ